MSADPECPRPRVRDLSGRLYPKSVLEHRKAAIYIRSNAVLYLWPNNSLIAKCLAGVGLAAQRLASKWMA